MSGYWERATRHEPGGMTLSGICRLEDLQGECYAASRKMVVSIHPDLDIPDSFAITEAVSKMYPDCTFAIQEEDDIHGYDDEKICLVVSRVVEWITDQLMFKNRRDFNKIETEAMELQDELLTDLMAEE
jgi:hypothetical protein